MSTKVADSRSLNALRERFERLRSKHARLSGIRQSVLAREAELVTRVGHAKGRLALAEEADAALEGLQRLAHERSVGAFERLLSAILTDVLPGTGPVKLALGTERGQPALYVQIENDGCLEDAKDDSGGAVTNVLVAGLRYAALSRTGNRLFMTLDEPDCWLKPDRVRAFINVIAQVATRAKTQTLLVSHHEPALFEGLVNLVRLIEGPNGPQAQVIEPRVSSWEDETTPGIRSIQLINFKAHRNTTIPLFPGVTALIGDNNLGKSTAANYALRAVAYGESDDSSITHHEVESKIIITLEQGRRIEWERRLNGNPRVTYSLYENGVLKRQGRQPARGQVPSWVTEILGIARADELDIQLVGQKDPPFLLSQSPSVRAQLLSVGRESGRLHELIESYGSLKRKDKEIVREGEEEILKLRFSLGGSGALSALASQVEQLAQEIADLEGAQARHARMEQLLARLTVLEEHKTRAEAFSAALVGLPKHAPTLQETQALARLIQVLSANERAATLHREFPSVQVQVPELDLSPRNMARLIGVLEQTGRIAQLVREFPVVEVPELDLSTRDIARVLGVLQQTERIAQLARQFPEITVPTLHDQSRLRDIGGRIARLAPRVTLDQLPQLPSEPGPLHDTASIAKAGAKLKGHAQQVGELKKQLGEIQAEESTAQEELKMLRDSLGGMCPLCEGLLPEEIGGDHRHVHVEAA